MVHLQNATRLASVIFALSASFAFCQEATIRPIFGIHSDNRGALVNDISNSGVAVGQMLAGDGGDVAFRWTERDGVVELSPSNSTWPRDEAFAVAEDEAIIVGSWSSPCRWVGTGNGELELRYDGSGAAEAVSRDGSVAVGSVFSAGPFRWTGDGELEFFHPFGQPFQSTASDVSGDGRFIVGRNVTSGRSWLPYRWSAETGMQILAHPEIGGEAYATNRDGSLVVLRVDSEGYIWSPTEGLQQLLPGDNYEITQYPLDMSDDGSLIVGSAIWIDRKPHHLEDLLEDAYGVDTSDWTFTHALGCSPDGTKIGGYGLHKDNPRGGHVGYVVTLPSPPKIEADLSQDGVLRGSVGSTAELVFTARDPGGEPLSLGAEALPSSAVLSLPIGVPLSATVQGKLVWTPTQAEAGVQRSVRIFVRDAEGRTSSLRFRIEAEGNHPPEVEAPLPVIVECVPGANVVDLETLVDDVEGDALTVSWRVDGKEKKVETVPAGSLAGFRHQYSHGEHVVEIRVSDRYNVATAETAVTVQDTQSPIVIVAPRLELQVERGELYARSSRLRLPRVQDACEHEPTVTSDAPARLPIGKHLITWNVRDAGGNEATGRQLVVVKNATPVAIAGKDRQVQTGSRIASVRLNGSASRDADGHSLKYLWKAPGVRFDDPKVAKPKGAFPLGSTTATLTVIDEAGRRSQDAVKVTVRRATRRSASAARENAAEARQLASRSLSRLGLVPNRNAAWQEADHAFALSAYPATRIDADDLDQLVYREVRGRQSAHAYRASCLLYEMYFLTGEDLALAASVEAYHSALHVLHDLAD